MEGEDEQTMSQSLTKKHGTSVKTRKEKKKNHFMKEAERRTQESLERMRINNDEQQNQDPNMGS